MTPHAPEHRALLVEDERNLATPLRIALKRLGLQVAHATTLAEAAAHLKDSAPELVVLDRRLPDGDGMDLCKDLREQGFMGRILMLTALGQTQDRVSGLNAGADDYLPKPFAWEELAARVNALLRRPALETTPRESWQLDSDRLRVQGPRGWITLTPLEFKLASKLIEARGAILGRDALLKDVWGFQLLPKTRTVDYFLVRLRRHFELDPENPRHFVTVRGAGYRFVA